jgi:hypothetical protein
MVLQEIKRKDFPNNYTDEIGSIIDAISFDKDKVEVLGSMSFRSLLYSSDYDLYEIVNTSSLKTTAKQFQSIIRKLMKRKDFYFGDIKIGSVDEWEVIDEYEEHDDYNYEKTKSNIETLFKNKIISKKEFESGMKLIKPILTPIEFIEMKKENRFHILRWSPQEILQNKKKFRGNTYTLEDAMNSDGLFKLDCIARLENGVFQEISIIYELRIHNKRISKKRIDVPKSLEEAIVYYSKKGSWFKVCKRLWSLLNYNILNRPSEKKKSIEVLEKLFDILNSDIGILYQVSSYIDILVELLEDHNVKPNVLKGEIDTFIERLANVYSVKSYLDKEKKILDDIRSLLQLKVSKNKMINGLEKIQEELAFIMNEETKKRLFKLDFKNILE